MLSLSLYYNYWEDWQLFHKVTFDGVNKLIIINDEVEDINIKQDVYSDWKEWVRVRENSKFDSAFRTVGGDITPTGALGATFFTINGWRILLRDTVNIVGNIYSDDFSSPYTSEPGVKLALSFVSNLIDSINVDLSGSGIPTASQNASAVRTELSSEIDVINQIPTDIQNIPSDVRTELSTELSRLDIAISTVPGGVWEEDRSDHVTSGSMGEYQSNIDTSLSALAGSLQVVRALLNENSITDQHVYDTDGNLTSARVRSYDTKSNAVAAGVAGLLQTFTINASYDSNGRLTEYRMVREGS